MRKLMKTAISESVQDMLNAGLGTSFTEKEFKELGIITTDFKPNKALISQYTRREATAKLAQVLDEAITH